jgi:UTP--glucose-1-phosphate uridylyltransferase
MNNELMNPLNERRTNGDRRKIRKVRKAIFPAAGLGTRFLPATKAQPKEMLPLVDKPIIQYGVEEALAAGCDQIIMITGRGKSAIEDHFDVSYELEKMLEEKGKYDLLKIVRQISDMIFVAYVRQKEALGLGHAVLTARELIGDEPFATLACRRRDRREVPVLKQLMNVFDEKQCSVIATQIVDGPAISAYGVMKAKEVAGPAEDSLKFSIWWKSRSSRTRLRIWP